ncbi:methyltransferase domain-containing protein [Aestuariibacter sp. A3R04]|uniref:methyltransferase domain-containing protein n=1 Tax=Aestuariibacter sp. A3R04 TaxID=2841571 RepID=UPI001C0824C3|nr:methyltransferase domain-containing protein [Aestuariibacter sp. A3R04]MBU3022479.1 methyltransferase domain-containing protein [Aestuariibacter sp. A3R04]
MMADQTVVACPRDCVRKKAIAARFSKACRSYDETAHIQATIASDVRDRMGTIQGGALLDIGCATGTLTAKLKTFASAITAVDISPKMISSAQSRHRDIQFFEGQAEALPFQNDIFHLVYSSMALQWVSSPGLAMDEIHRVLKKRGTAYLAIMVAGSFQELISARAAASLPDTVNSLASVLAWQNAAISSGLNIQGSAITSYVDRFSNVRQLLRSITGVGAGLSLANASVKPLNRTKLDALQKVYVQDDNRLFPLTYQVLHLTLEK